MAQGSQSTTPAHPRTSNEASIALLQDHQKSHAHAHELQSYPTQPPNYQEATSAIPLRRTTFRDVAKKAQWAAYDSIRHCYQQANFCIILQFVLSFFVLGSAAATLDKRDGLPETTPIAIAALAFGVWFILTLFFRLRYSAASPTTAKPPTSYLVWTGIYILLWGAALACSIVLFVMVKPYKDERDMNVKSYTGCRKSEKKPCHPFTKRSVLFTNGVIMLSTCSAALAFGFLQIWILSRLWRRQYTEAEMRSEYEATPKLPKINFRASFKEGWTKGWESERAKQAAAQTV